MTPVAQIGLMMDSNDTARLIYLGILLAALCSWVMIEYRQRMGQALRTALAWAMIFVGLMAGYGLWSDIRRDVLPVQYEHSGAVNVPLAADGHYHLDLTIDGTKTTFMADTGASSVVLSPGDARRLGIKPEMLAYLGQASTANGIVQTATVTLKNVTFGPFFDEVVTAQVNQSEMDSSLLGMDYLGRFSVTMSGGKMVVSR